MTKYRPTAALNNAQTNSGDEPKDSSLCEGLASNALPEAQCSQTGVSVENTLSATNPSPISQSPHPNGENPQWFVLRVSYGRAIKAEEILKDYNIEIFNPLHRVVKMVKGKRRRVQSPLLPGLIFAHADARALASVMKEPGVNSLVTYYYDHFSIGTNGLNPPLIVPDQSMESFIIAATADSHDVRVVNPKNVHYKSGDIVRVTVGEFKGVIGRVARAAGQQRVIVNLHGVCLLATAYIPTGCLEIIIPAEETKK